VSETGTPRATEAIGENEGRMSNKIPWQTAEARTRRSRRRRLITNPNFAGEH
jgi:hypothetical protein